MIYATKQLILLVLYYVRNWKRLQQKLNTFKMVGMLTMGRCCRYMNYNNFRTTIKITFRWEWRFYQHPLSYFDMGVCAFIWNFRVMKVKCMCANAIHLKSLALFTIQCCSSTHTHMHALNGWEWNLIILFNDMWWFKIHVIHSRTQNNFKMVLFLVLNNNAIEILFLKVI